eukprot:2278386-Prymnesium_polylepis.1
MERPGHACALPPASRERAPPRHCILPCADAGCPARASAQRPPAVFPSHVAPSLLRRPRLSVTETPDDDLSAGLQFCLRGAYSQ